MAVLTKINKGGGGDLIMMNYFLTTYLVKLLFFFLIFKYKTNLGGANAPPKVTTAWSNAGKVYNRPGGGRGDSKKTNCRSYFAVRKSFMPFFTPPYLQFIIYVYSR